jgi:hypothetical protein
VHHTLQQRIAGGMTVRVVDSLQADYVDIGSDEQARRSAGTIHFVLKVGQARPSRARSGQRVRVSDRQLVQQRVAVCLGLQAVTGSLLAITGRLLAIHRGSSSSLSPRGAVSGGTPAALRGAQYDLRAGHRAPILRPGGVTRRQLAITQLGGVIALHRSPIASAGDFITSSSRLHTPQGASMALHGAAIAKPARQVMHVGVPALHEVAIAGRLIAVTGCLIAIGRCLISVGRRLIAVRPRLVGVRESHVAVSARLIVLKRPRIRSSAVLR